MGSMPTRWQPERVPGLHIRPLRFICSSISHYMGVYTWLLKAELRPLQGVIQLVLLHWSDSLSVSLDLLIC
jgi:hypothetical protein